MKATRSAPVLLLGFGMLIGLIALTGIGALQRARETYLDVSRLNQEYRHTDRVLSAIASGIFKVGLLTRDYLLDPSNTRAADYRAELVAERSAMEKELGELSGVVLDTNKPELERLRAETSAYWDALDPLFLWTPEEKAVRSWTFLRKEVLPRRQAALSIAQEFSRLTQANLDEQRREIDRRQAAMASLHRPNDGRHRADRVGDCRRSGSAHDPTGTALRAAAVTRGRGGERASPVVSPTGQRAGGRAKVDFAGASR